MTDGTKPKLKIPPWHIPYLEKHRMYELFQEIARELVIQQPVDHVLFIKQILLHASKAREIARIVLLSSPKVNSQEIARQINQFGQQLIITDDSIMSCFVKKTTRDALKPMTVAKIIAFLTRTENAHNVGWILCDCIRNPEEAKAVLQIGVLPTHVFHLIPPFIPPLNELLYCHVPRSWPEYRRNIMAIRSVFSKRLVEIFLRQRGLHEVVGEILNVIKIKKSTTPMIPRVLILGPRGCGRKTQAKILVEKHGVVHIDFPDLLCQMWISQTDLGERLRACKNEVCFHSDLLAEVVNQRILQDDCIESGWVLTGFPNTLSDFKHLDALDTPPNRVIFLECDLNVCKERIINRRVHMYTGKDYVLNEEIPPYISKLLKIHPKDRVAVVEAELVFYCEQYGSLRSYCGGTASVVNGNQPQRWIYETICAIIKRAAPPFDPRDPCSDNHPQSASGSSTSCPCTPIPSKVFDCYVTNY